MNPNPIIRAFAATFIAYLFAILAFWLGWEPVIGKIVVVVIVVLATYSSYKVIEERNNL